MTADPVTEPVDTAQDPVTSSELGGKVPLPDPYPVLDTSALLPLSPDRATPAPGW
ncbi:hypothetical protein [Actinacidiphila oryziradicis]|uniref:hypothetical protein n=1 Tax=Actinacidiphila oryziradicis TaxID=2571141 RepID=UPI0023F405A7|nr:hypothetical protein [Actinacidiphila oryziradicis]MCW2873413.1 hypothetical protein [Actinacidiphila oryziradicis]